MSPGSGYERRLSLFDATMVVVGGIIGAGIFLSPSIVAGRVESSGQVLLVWVLGGAIALLGALCFGELGARRPEAGGGYVYLKESFGRLPAFLYGWTQLLVINTGGIAAVAITFAGYAAELGGLGGRSIRPLAVGAILLLTGINYLGIRPGSITQNVFTLAKLAALAAVVGSGLWALGGGPPLAASAPPGPVFDGAADTAAGHDLGWRLLGAALIPVLFSYGGWQHVNHVAGEVRRPARNLPLALLLGVATVVVAYVLTNLAYLRVLGREGLAASAAPAAATLEAAFGPPGGKLIAVGIVCSTFGFVNLVVLAGARIYQAMAADGLFFRSVGRLHPRYHSPSRALVVQAVWAIALAVTGTYGKLLDYVVFGDWIFFALVVACLFVYRRRAADVADRAAYRTPGYPLTPLLFVVAATWVVVSSFLWNPGNALLGLSLIAAGVPVYLYWSRRR